MDRPTGARLRRRGARRDRHAALGEDAFAHCTATRAISVLLRRRPRIEIL